MKEYLGIDLGGTNLRVARVNEEGEVLQIETTESHALEGPEVVMGLMENLIEKVLASGTVQGIGIDVPGPVDTQKGAMTMSTNLKDFTGYPVVDRIQKRFNLPCYMDNDANTAGLAEALVGAGKGLPIVYYTTVSTGIGGALVVNGKVVAGKHGYAGEVANIIVDPTRPKVNHLNAGAVENWASGRSLTDQAKALLPDHTITHAGDLFELAQQGNDQALVLVDQFITYLARMYADIAHVVDPFMFVLGGGVTKSAAYWLPLLEKKYATMVHPPMQDVVFSLAALEEPGIIGAAMLPRSYGK